MYFFLGALRDIINMISEDNYMIFSIYGNCFKTLNTFLFPFSNKILVIRTGIHKRLVRIANREDPDQTVSSKFENITNVPTFIMFAYLLS